ncbi:MAG TPA: Bax inhibitor-1/YccA family protein [Tepidisphaeraceae bacterium]|nr:Bax inhibitor-1/YccA family protein [Tepidisphaeraceae bacterium]
MSQWSDPYQSNPLSGWREAGTSNPVLRRFFNAVYGWMCVGLAITGAVAWIVATDYQSMALMGKGIWLLFIVEIVLVMAVAGAINRINATVATILFLIYSAINGVILSGIFLVYAHNQGTLASAFFISAGTFGAMSLYGMFTKTNLAPLGRYLFMGLIGIIIASIVSIFWHNSLLEVAINYIGVLLFVALTAYDTQRLKGIAVQTQDSPSMAARMAIVGSLMLYLDFINLFLFILSLMSDRRR